MQLHNREAERSRKISEQSKKTSERSKTGAKIISEVTIKATIIIGW